jgi:hypothetical protein
MNPIRLIAHYVHTYILREEAKGNVRERCSCRAPIVRPPAAADRCLQRHGLGCVVGGRLLSAHLACVLVDPTQVAHARALGAISLATGRIDS